MSKDFTSHLLSFDEGIYVRAHPFDIVVVKVKRTIAQINETRAQLEQLEAKLDSHVADLNERMKK